MTLSMIGTGYVGLTTGTGFAEMGNEVICVDIDKKKIDALNNGVIPIYEPGLEELVKRNVKEKRLHFSTDIKYATQRSQHIFLAVGTPPGEDGSADLQYVLKAAKEIARHMDSYKIITVKSTVPVGTGYRVREAIQNILDERAVQIDFDTVSNPEFLKEGAAIDDFMKPDRIIVGVDNDRAMKAMDILYRPLTRNRNRIIYMDIPSAEMCKYAANAMLATRISFMNEIARLCEKVGANVEHIRNGLGSDKRIGSHFIYPGLGYGGSCFPKDVKALLNTGESNDEPMLILKAVEQVNQNQRNFFINKILRFYNGKIQGLRFAIWGLAFKPGTDDMREAPSIDIINYLLSENATVSVYDPVALDEAKTIFGTSSHIVYADDQYEVVQDADALCLITEWKNFREPDFLKIKTGMKNPVIFDGRNQYDPDMIKSYGFQYHSIGRKP